MPTRASPIAQRLVGGHTGKFDDELPPPPQPAAKVVSLPSAQRPQKTGFPVVWASDAQINVSARPIVKGLIEPGGFMVIYGPSGSGKSFFTADLAEHIALGNPWRGRKVSAGLVVYIAAEAGASILKRFVAWRENRLSESVPSIPLAILTKGPNLIAGVDFEILAEQLVLLQQESGQVLQLVVFDTLSRSMPGGDENNAEDMTRAIRSADYLREQFNCATAFVHHSGKDPDRGARGHSALFAAADVVMRVMDGEARVEKVRDGVAGEAFPFVLEPVQVGEDADGDPVVTCLLNATDFPLKPAAKLPTGRNQRIALAALRELAAEQGERSPGSSITPRGALIVSFSTAVEAIAPKFGTDDPAFRVREKIRDAILGLQSAGFVGVHGDLLWML